MGSNQSVEQNVDETSIKYTDPPEIFKLFDETKKVDKMIIDEVHYPDPDSAVGFLTVKTNEEINFVEEYYIRTIYSTHLIKKISYTLDGSKEVVYPDAEKQELGVWASSLVIKSEAKIAVIEMSRVAMDEGNFTELAEKTEEITSDENGIIPHGYKILGMDTHLKIGNNNFGTPDGVNYIPDALFQVMRTSPGEKITCAKMNSEDYLGENRYIYNYKFPIKFPLCNYTGTILELKVPLPGRFTRYVELIGLKQFKKISFIVGETEIFSITSENEKIFRENNNIIIPFSGDFRSRMPTFIFPVYSFSETCRFTKVFVKIEEFVLENDLEIISHNTNYLGHKNGIVLLGFHDECLLSYK